MLAHNPILITVELLAVSVWVGSLVCLAVVASAARASLDAQARVTFFRALGRRYGIVGDGALAVAIGIGLTMAWPPASWDRLEDAAVALAGALVVATAIGVRQARAMTRLRRHSLANDTDERYRASGEGGSDRRFDPSRPHRTRHTRNRGAGGAHYRRLTGRHAGPPSIPFSQVTGRRWDRREFHDARSAIRGPCDRAETARSCLRLLDRIGGSSTLVHDRRRPRTAEPSERSEK